MDKNIRNIRKLTKTGRGSMYVILPREFIASLGWREKQKLMVNRVSGGIMIKDWHRPSVALRRAQGKGGKKR